MQRRAKRLVTYGKSSPSNIHAYTENDTGHPASSSSRPQKERVRGSRGSHLSTQAPQLASDVVRGLEPKPGAPADCPSDNSTKPAKLGGDSGSGRRKRRKFAFDNQSEATHLYKDSTCPAGEMFDAGSTRKHGTMPISSPTMNDGKGDPEPRSKRVTTPKYEQNRGNKANQDEKEGETSSKSYSRIKEGVHSQNALNSDAQHTKAAPRKRLVDSLGVEKHPAEYETSISGGESQISKVSPNSGRVDDHPLFATPTKATMAHSESPQQLTSPLSSRLPSSRVTYARQRSFLNDISLMGSAEGPMVPSVPTRFNQRQPLFPPKPSQTLDYDDDDDYGNDNKPVRSIHELRQAGDNARFRESLDSIFEDIEDSCNSISGRCNSLCQLCTKLLDSQLAHRFSECGFDDRLVKCIKTSFDTISASLSLVIYKLVCTRGGFAYTHLQNFWSKLLELAPSLLDVGECMMLLVRKRSSGLSKHVQTYLTSMLPRLLPIVCSEVPYSEISPRLMALLSLQSSLSSFRGKGDITRPIPGSLMNHIVALSRQKHPHTADFPLAPDHFNMLVLVFSVLETYTGLLPLDHNNRDAVRPLSELHHLLYSHICNQSRQLLVLYTRVILNLTNNDSSLCEEFATSEIITGFVRIVTSESLFSQKDPLSIESIQMDTVLLALGALINLVEKSEGSRTIFLRSKCGDISLIQILLDHFTDKINIVSHAHSAPQVHHSVITGYLSILLVTLCLDIEARLRVQKSLGENGLAMVLSTAEEFLQYHQKAEQDFHAFEAQSENSSSLSSRLKHFISLIKEQERHL